MKQESLACLVLPAWCATVFRSIGTTSLNCVELVARVCCVESSVPLQASFAQTANASCIDQSCMRSVYLVHRSHAMRVVTNADWTNAYAESPSLSATYARIDDTYAD
jgi:hypothetical protein